MASSKQGITRTQKEVFDYVSGFISEQGFSPSYEEIAAATGKSSQNVRMIIMRLISRGHLAKGSGHRSLSIPDEVRS